MAGCPAFDVAAPYVSAVLSFTDCQALALAADGWSALGPGTAFGAVLTGLLTVLVALLGYRLLLGEMLSLREATAVAVRIGMVIALATQWSAWQVLVFAVATQGPPEIAGAILAPGGLEGADAGLLAARLQGVSDALDALAHPAAAALPPPAGDLVAQVSQPAPAAAELPPDLRKTIASADAVLLVAGLGGLVAVRVVAAVLLAVGPVFIGLLLFDATRGLFASWARVLGGAALGAVAVPAVLALALAVIRPQVASLQAQLAGGEFSGNAADQIWASVVIFALVLLGAVLAVVRAAAGLRLPVGFRANYRAMIAPVVGSAAAMARAAPSNAPNGGDPAEGRGRVQRIADAARAMERRDHVDRSASLRRDVPGASARPASRDRSDAPLETLRLGQGARRSGQRRSTGALRRDDQR